jgi:hypothetical protein
MAARERHHLSHAHVQMARELGLDPKRLGKIDNHDQQPWKAPLPEYLEHLHRKRIGRDRPEVVSTIEQQTRAQQLKRRQRKEAKRRARSEDAARRAGEAAGTGPGAADDVRPASAQDGS